MTFFDPKLDSGRIFVGLFHEARPTRPIDECEFPRENSYRKYNVLDTLKKKVSFFFLMAAVN